VLAYLATKEQFLTDAPQIEDIVKKSVFEKLNLSVGKSEYEAWRNSLGNAMFHVINGSKIPNDAGVAVEYRLNGRRFRIDFMIAGQDNKGNSSVVIVELKQWTDIKPSPTPNHVITYLGGGLREERHPSYQAWSYQSHLELYNEFIYSEQVRVNSCAYLHNCVENSVVASSLYEELLSKSPVFIKGELGKLRILIEKQIIGGDGVGLIKEIDQSPIRPSKQLAEAVGNMLKGDEEFVLLDEQVTVYEKIIEASRASQSGSKQVLIVKGGPGTGKSVISINALAALTRQRLNVKYVTPNAAPRSVYESKLKDRISGDAFRHMFSGSGSFHKSERNDFDVLIVDEAHRLSEKSGFYKNEGENQIKEIINSSACSVFFVDEAQKVTWSDIGEIGEIKRFASESGAKIQEFELISQFRCGGSDDYLEWLEGILGIKNTTQLFSRSAFDFKVFESATELHNVIREKNIENNKSRVVAGYCWNWDSKKNPKLFDIRIPEEGYKAQWNLSDYGNNWIIDKESIDEVGCIHTCQGLELDYVGVIIGEDLVFDGSKLITDPSKRAKTDQSLKGYKKERKEDPVSAETKADELIRNTYRTLMSRGMKGCYIFAVDKKTREFFIDAIERLPKGIP
jgi:DUF2075 family protein